MIYPALIASVIGWRGATLLGLLSKIKHVYVCVMCVMCLG